MWCWCNGVGGVSIGVSCDDVVSGDVDVSDGDVVSSDDCVVSSGGGYLVGVFVL